MFVKNSDENAPPLSPRGHGAPGKLPQRTIPGSYGIPFISPIKDRLEFFSNQDQFFQSRVDRYASTVVRLNAPPGPFMAKNPQVIAILDGKSFPVLFDNSKVEKKNVLTGTYMPSTSLYGGYRVCSYLDPSEPNHTKIKQLIFNLLLSRKDHLIPEFAATYEKLFRDMEEQLAKSGKFAFNGPNDEALFKFFGRFMFGVNPSDTELGSDGVLNSNKWLFAQLSPLMTLGLPQLLEELILHTFPIPSFLVKRQYEALYRYFGSAATDALDMAEKLGLSREEACHNLLFVMIFNAWAGVRVLFPDILLYLSEAGSDLHARLASEVRSAVSPAGGGLSTAALEKMPLTKSVVYEALRMNPPVKYQYGVAKKDLVIESHDASFEVKAGEMLFGYQPFATKDKRIFGPDAGKFVGDRFMGEKSSQLLQFLVWSNGPETENSTVINKQCAGKNVVVLVARLLVAEFFLRYDTFKADSGTGSAGVSIISITKAKTGKVADQRE